MFAAMEETIDHALEQRREGRLCEWRALCQDEARIARRKLQLAREFDDERDWEAAGCSSNAAWIAQISSSDYHAAARITRTGEALRVLPELDEALRSGALSLDQVAAAAEFATPETDGALARAAVGRAPREVGRVARTLAPPKAADDEELYHRRELRMAWTRGHRELAISGRLPLEQGAVFAQTIQDIAKRQRAADTRDGVTQTWQQSCADALVALAQNPGSGPSRGRTTLIVHAPADEPPFIEGAGTISPETAERLTCNARRLTIKPDGRDLVHSRVTRCASYAQLRALHRRDRHCRYPGCTATLSLDAHHLHAWDDGGDTVLDNLILLCHRHHTHVHDHHIRTSGRADAPIFTRPDGRAPPG